MADRSAQQGVAGHGEDQQVARKDENDQPPREFTGSAEGDVNGDEESFISQRIKFGAEFGMLVEAACKEAVNSIGEPSEEKQCKGKRPLACVDGPCDPGSDKEAGPTQQVGQSEGTAHERLGGESRESLGV